MNVNSLLSKKELILFIDPDNPEYFRRFSVLLEDCELSIISSHDEAVKFFLMNKVDLVILNHTARASCLKLLKSLKSIKSFVPVIITTNCSSEELVVTVFRYGAKDYFKKPFSFDEFIKSIRSALRAEGIMHDDNGDEIVNGNGLFRAIRFINNNYNKQIKLNQIATEAGMSISCFARTFKNEMGVTFTMYVNSLRISKASRLLSRNGMSMSEIAFASGFTNQFYFTRTFKKVMKITPTLYRQSHKLNNSLPYL